MIAVGAVDRQVVVLDRESGESIWRQRVNGTLQAGPLLDVDRLYVATEQAPEGRVYALRLSDGHQLWSRATGSVTAPLVLDRDAVYAATEGGRVLRLRRDRGTVIWRQKLSGAVRAGPVRTGAGLVVATTADSLYLLDLATGRIVARRSTPGAVLGTPALAGTRLFLGTTAGRLLEIAVPALEVQWELNVEDGVYGAPAVSDDTLFALTRAGHLWIVPINASGMARSHSLDVVAVAGPTPTASGVLVASIEGEVLLVDSTTGEICWRAQVEAPVEQPPLVMDRQLIVVGGRGAIHTYR